MQKIYTLLLAGFWSLWSHVVVAESSVGEVAGNAIVPVGVTATFMENVSLVVFIGFYCGAVFQFIARRNNPEIPMSRIVWFLIFGTLAGIFWYVQRFNTSGA